MANGYFVCKNCGKKVKFEAIGTKNRNHCPFCLYSLHVDRKFAGDRASSCQGLMKPIGLTFKKEKPNKFEVPSSLRSGYLLPLLRRERNPSEAESSSHSSPPKAGFFAKGDKKEGKGEIMLIHECQKCGVQTKNRIAGDDNSEAIFAIGEEKDKFEIEKQLFGKK